MLCFLSCYADDSQPASGFSPTGIYYSTVSDLPCQADNILTQVAALLSGFTFEAHYLIIRDQFVLSIWLVVPEIDPYADKQAVDANSRLAFLKGVRICHTVTSQIPCVRELFNAINPMIVDEKYNCWYRDIIPIQNLLAGQDATDEELLQAVKRRDMKYSYRRTVPPQFDNYESILDVTMWKEFRKSIQGLLCKELGRCNAAAYPMFLSDYCIVQVYWQALTERELENAYALKRMEWLAQSFSHISLPIARLDMCIVNNEDKLAIYGKVDGYALRSKDNDFILKDEIRLYHMP